MPELDEYDLQALENRKKFAQEGEMFGRNFILGTDFATLEEAKVALEKANPGKLVRFDTEHVVTDDGLVMSGSAYADR